MTAKSNLAKKVPADIALVVYGTDRSKKPQASRFGLDAAKSFQAAARASGMQILRIVSDRQREVARRLPKGTVSSKGRPVLSVVRPALYNQLLAVVAVDPAPAGGSEKPDADTPKKPGSAGVPSDTNDRWTKLAKGSEVLALEARDSGWWEAIVQHREGDVLTLTWRDFLAQGQFTRKVVQVAMLHPDLVEAW